ncbi:hypothetical protein [Helicobacter suis]|uniref:hypothetical protein n=1 Tax=Helicobacter suis TaxID=104628 RepID=UPI0013D4EB5E|nr:hypothetical protein [Helicobacter suis]
MRGRLIKFVNPQSAQIPPAPSAAKVVNTSTQSAAPEVSNTSAPTQAELTDQEKQERLDLINKLVRANNITNEAIAPLGLHFEYIEPFNGVVWRNNELT